MWVDFPRSRIIPVSDTEMEADFRHSFAGLKLMLHPLTHTFAPLTGAVRHGSRQIGGNHLNLAPYLAPRTTPGLHRGNRAQWTTHLVFGVNGAVRKSLMSGSGAVLPSLVIVRVATLAREALLVGAEPSAWPPL